MQLLWSQIKTEFFSGCNADIDRFENGLKTASWAWDAKLVSCNIEEVDRRGDILLGPLFCSTSAQWPTDEFGPQLPIAQFNLSKISRITGEDFGSELLQLFCSQSDRLGQNIEFRKLSADILNSEEMLEPPSIFERNDGFVSIDWSLPKPEHANIRNIGKCSSISYSNAKRFNLWMPCKISDEYSLEDCNYELKEAIKEFDGIIENHEDEWSPGGFHLLGTFHPIQYYQKDRRKVFFNLESESGLNFGWGGTAQIFFHIHPEFGSMFSFDWSCS